MNKKTKTITNSTTSHVKLTSKEEREVIKNHLQALLFLDFDGVLHPAKCQKNQFFSKLPVFCALFETLTPRPGIVISSTWRNSYPLNMLRKIFPKEVRKYIIGSTPRDKNDSTIVDRTGEINSFLAIKNMTHLPYIVLDDTQQFFSEKRNLYVVDGESGLIVEDIVKIKDIYKRIVLK